MTEAQITKAVMDHWRTCGLEKTLVASIPNMGARGQYGLTKGLPDLLVITPGGVGFIELKTEKGRPTKEQQAFKVLCISNEIRHSITYGREQPIKILEHWGAVRKQVRA